MISVKCAREKIAALIRNWAPTAAEKLAARNSRSGITGSGARTGRPGPGLAELDWAGPAGPGYAWPVSKRLIFPPVTVKAQRVRMAPQVSLRNAASRDRPPSVADSTSI